MSVKRVLISIDEQLLARIDDACARLGTSRSAFIAQSASRDLEGAVGPGADPAARAALATIDELVDRARR